MTRSLATLRFLKILMAASIGLPLLLFIFASWLNYKAAFVTADERILRSLEVVHEHSLKVFQSAEVLLEAVNEIAGRLPDREVTSDEEQLHAALRRVSEPLPNANSVWLFAADGTPLVTNFRFPAPKNFKNNDRDYFLAQVPSNAGTYVGSV